MTVERKELDLGGGNAASIEYGYVEVRYVGMVQAETTKRVMTLAPSVSGEGPITAVYVIDIRQLEGFTAEARKVFSSARGQAEKMELYLYIVGATIKSKAIFALVLAAARLVGSLTFHLEYVDSLEVGRARGYAKRDALVASGVIPPAP